MAARPSPRVSRPVVALLLALLGAGALAAQSIEVNVDRNRIGFDEQVLMAIRVQGSQQAAPQLPELPEFQVVSRGRQTEMQIVNGQVTRSVTFNYVLVPRSVGTFTIPPAKVEIDGRTYESQSFQITVTEASTEPGESRDHFLTVRISEEEPWVGQQVLYTWRFYWRVRPADARLSPLEFGDLLVEDLGEVREYQTTVNGVQYAVSEIRKALFAQRPGEFTLAPSELTISVPVERGGRRSLFDDFFGSVQTRTRTLRSEPVVLKVDPLPPAPDDFSGLVGDFEVQTAVSRRELSVGESTTLEITIAGTGNAQLIAEPDLPDLGPFKVYDDTPTSSLERSGTRLRGSKVFRKALVPLTAGTLTLGSIDLTYFDPESGAYATASSAPIDLEVTPGEGEEELMLTESVAPTTGKVAVRILADDILPIHRGLDALEDQTLSGWRAWLWAAAWLSPPLLVTGFWLLRRRQLRERSDTSLLRRRRALRRAIDDLEVCRQADDMRERARGCSRALRGFIGDKLGVEGSALTPLEAQELLEDAGVEGPLARRSREILDRLEAVQYASAALPPAEPPPIEELLRDLEKALDTAGRGGDS